jgi:thiol-disulfide isomerase/thioredoxin
MIVAIIIAATGGDDSGGESDTPQARPVEITGDPLVQYTQQPVDEDPAAGVRAPTVVGSDFSGAPVEIAADGRPKAIVFLAHWCPHCQAEVPQLAAWLDDNSLPEGMDLVLVPTATDPSRGNYPPSEWLGDAGLGDVPTLVDDEQSDTLLAFGAGPFPYWVFLDADHDVVARLSGEFPDDPQVFTTLFDDLAAGRPIEDPRA